MIDRGEMHYLSHLAPLGARRFFVAGVPKGGTTALCAFLGQHRQVFMCPIKEPNFFAASELMAIENPSMRSSIEREVLAAERWLAGDRRKPQVKGLVLNWKSYALLFDGMRDELAVGEGSTAYWWAPGAPSAICERYPDARFIIMLRNPADRFFSQYLATKWRMPDLTCGEYFSLARSGHEDWKSLEAIGRYATNLQRFFKKFSRRQISIHLYEDFCRNPRAVCRKIFGFLGTDVGHSINVSARLNEPRLPRWPALPHLYRSLPGSQIVWRAMSSKMRDKLRHFAQKPRSQEAMNSADRREVAAHYRDEILGTAELIDRDLSSWLE